MQLSGDDVEDEGSYVGPMEDAGYVLRVWEPGHRMFRTPTLDMHIHVCDAQSEWERRHLLFRDWLRHSPEDRARYDAAKRLLVRRDWEDMNEYAAAKNAIIAEIGERPESWAVATGWRP